MAVFYPEFVRLIDKTLSRVLVTKEQIIKIINNFGINKAHECDGIAVVMLKLCAVEISTSLVLIFKKYIISGVFPDSWKYD